MEPHDLDKIFRQKIGEGNAQYAGEAAESKERIWQKANPAHRRPYFGWIKYAAAILLLFAAVVVFFSFGLDKKNTQISQLTAQVDMLNQSLKTQQKHINFQEKQISELSAHVQQTKAPVDPQSQKSIKNPAVVREVKYVTDTVFVPITPKMAKNPALNVTVGQENKIAKILVENRPQHNEVHFVLSGQETGENTKNNKESTKLKWGKPSQEDGPAKSLAFRIKL